MKEAFSILSNTSK